MGEIIQFNQHRTESKTLADDVIALSKNDVHKVEHIRDSIETALEKVANLENMPLTVAMAAGRYAAMRMFQIQGRAETMAFMDECVLTAELCDDLMQHLDDDV
jgi:hypothetical protein|tara:strand:- start:654 stop:962 length:309 start_codon:yes stop_codon:yes gene_type:complete